MVRAAVSAARKHQHHLIGIVLALFLCLPVGVARAQIVDNHGENSGAGCCLLDDASNATLPAARYNLHVGNFASPYDYDPLCDGSSSTHDCSPAINTAAAITATGSGVNVNVHLQAGNYYAAGQINIANGQILYGDGRGTTNILIDQAFDPAAIAVFALSSNEDQGPQIRDLNISFSQPSDQSSRAAFQSLGSCTSGTGGTGCKYPPAIKALSVSSRYMLSNVRIIRAWDGLDSSINAVWWIDTLEMSSLDVGLHMDGALDFSHIKGFHFWNFGINAATALFTGVFDDGNNFAAKFGRMDDITLVDFNVYHGRVQINDANFGGEFSNVFMDGNNATFEVLANKRTMISNLSTIGNANNTTNTNCEVQIGASNQVTLINNWHSTEGGNATLGTLCASGGTTQVANSNFIVNSLTIPAVNVTGGKLVLNANVFNVISTGMTVQPISQTTGALVMVGNSFPQGATDDVGSVLINTDTVGNYISSNRFGPWPVVFATPLTTPLGYYDLGDQAFALTVTQTFGTMGDYAPTSVTSSGYYFLRGDFVDFSAASNWANNVYTTASGTFFLNLIGAPLAVSTATARTACSLGLMSGFVQTYTPGCEILPNGSNTAIQFLAVSTGTGGSVYSTTQSPAPKNGMAVRLSGRYRTRL